MNFDRRIGQASGGLTARERVVLYVRAVLEHRPLDRTVGAGMPDWQVPEANYLIGVANGILHGLLPQALILQQEVETLTARFNWLITLAAWGSERVRLRNALSLLASVPIAQEDFDRLVSEGREEWLSLGDAAELLEVLDRRPDGPTTEADYRREIGTLIGAGSLRTRGAGASTEVQAGSVYDHLGASYVPIPANAWSYQPMPADEFERSKFRVALTESALSATDVGPGLPSVPLTADSIAGTDVDDGRRRLARRVRDDVLDCWARLLAIEAVTAEAVATLGDEAVVPEVMTSLLERARSALEALFPTASELLGIDARPALDEELVELLRGRLVAQQTRQL